MDGLPPTELRALLSEFQGAYDTLSGEVSTLQSEIARAEAAGSVTLLPPAAGAAQAIELSLDTTFPPEYSTLAAVIGRLPASHIPSLSGPPPAPQPLSLPAGTSSAPVSIDFLLLLHKKLCAHALSLVFKRPVTSREAPGYDQKIMFPMDLSLVRKMIINEMVTTLDEFRRHLNLMLHNCIKFNGWNTE
jgi:hypothetical protein